MLNLIKIKMQFLNRLVKSEYKPLKKKRVQVEKSLPRKYVLSSISNILDFLFKKSE